LIADTIFTNEEYGTFETTSSADQILDQNFFVITQIFVIIIGNAFRDLLLVCLRSHHVIFFEGESNEISRREPPPPAAQPSRGDRFRLHSNKNRRNRPCLIGGGHLSLKH
jgi:hypothetical protein